MMGSELTKEDINNLKVCVDTTLRQVGLKGGLHLCVLAEKLDLLLKDKEGKENGTSSTESTPDTGDS